MSDIDDLLKKLGLSDKGPLDKTAAGASLGAQIGGGLGATSGALSFGTAPDSITFGTKQAKKMGMLEKFLKRAAFGTIRAGDGAIKLGIPAALLGAAIGGGQDLGDYFTD